MKRVIEEADGIQPHLVAPEAGYRRLLEEALGYLKDPCEKSVEEVGARGGGGATHGGPGQPCRGAARAARVLGQKGAPWQHSAGCGISGR